MKKVTVDARAFADAMSKVSKVLKKSALPMLEEIAVSVKARMLYAGRNRHGHMARSRASGSRR